MEREQSHSIYLVDDNKTYLGMLEKLLKQKLNKKFSFKVFNTGEECLQELRTTSPDVVVLDYHLNGVSSQAAHGLRILQSIKNLSKHTQVIMLSSQEKLEIAVDSMKWGAYDYVVKNETAFVKITHLINVISHTINLETESKKRKQRIWIIIIAYLICISYILIYLKTHTWL
jgi:two-component system OmpR family response regulator